MKTFAPEFSALMTIFLSAGPVISTRRSSRSGGIGATVHSRLANVMRFFGKPRELPSIVSGLTLITVTEQIDSSGFEQPVHGAQKLHCLRSEDFAFGGSALKLRSRTPVL